jgi:hypothetical protein
MKIKSFTYLAALFTTTAFGMEIVQYNSSKSEIFGVCSKNSNIKSIKLLLEQNPSLIVCTNEQKQTPLHCLGYTKQWDTMIALMKYIKEDPRYHKHNHCFIMRDNNGYSPFSLVAYYADHDNVYTILDYYSPQQIAYECKYFPPTMQSFLDWEQQENNALSYIDEKYLHRSFIIQETHNNNSSLDIFKFMLLQQLSNRHKIDNQLNDDMITLIAMKYTQIMLTEKCNFAERQLWHKTCDLIKKLNGWSHLSDAHCIAIILLMKPEDKTRLNIRIFQSNVQCYKDRKKNYGYLFDPLPMP